MKVTEWRQRKSKFEYSPFDPLYDKLAAIHGIEDLEKFLNPDYNELHSPYLLKNIEKAIHRISVAINNNENIVIHADTDYDGCSSCAIMYRYLKKHTENVHYIHAQRSAGHGVSNSILDVPDNTDVLIVVDSSSDEVDVCKELAEKGIDIIIIDHHTIQDFNPHCILINPKQEGCGYPNKDVSGGLLCWKVCKVLDDHFKSYYANPLVDLAGLSVVADAMDMMKLENRAMVNTALKYIQNPGLLALIKAVGKNEKYLTCTEFLYNVSPCITAATRFDKLGTAIELLISDDPEECKSLAKELIKMNNERKKIQTKTYLQYKEVFGDYPVDKCLIVVDNSIGRGFNGVVASDLCTYYNRPVIVFGESENENEYAGSFRSTDDIDFLEVLSHIPETTFFAGHIGAGGTGVKKTDIGKFQNSLNSYLSSISNEQHIEYDLELLSWEVDEKLIREILKFYKICGKGFSPAKFLIDGLIIKEKELIGSDKSTIKIKCDGIELMKFKSDHKFFDSIPVGVEIKAIGTLGINAFYNFGKKKMILTNQLKMDDFQIIN